MYGSCTVLAAEAATQGSGWMGMLKVIRMLRTYESSMNDFYPGIRKDAALPQGGSPAS